MFRLSSRQTFKALRSPLRSLPYPLRLFSSCHAMQVPFSGPPTYDAVARRFSSYPNPTDFFVRKNLEEARDRGEFIDIHDVSGVDPKDYDVLITDLDNEKMRSELAEIVGIEYLAKATEADAKKVVEIGHGYIYGRGLRTIFPCVVSLNGKAHWIFFLVDSGALFTYLSTQASKLFDIRIQQPTPVKIAGYQHHIYSSPPNSHFAELNLLGADFVNMYNVSTWLDSSHQKVKFYFGRGWEPPTRKSK